MGRHVVVGQGAVGTATARALATGGHTVVQLSRSGAGAVVEGVERRAVDAGDAAALAAACRGADALYNCANPAYHRWAQDWPPIAAAMLAAAETSGAVLVTMSNLYGYGPVDHPMTPADPLAGDFPNARVRVAMWEAALAAHRAGRVRATEARASDFFGPGTESTSHLGHAMPALRAGRTVRVVGDPDQPHTWTYVPDVGTTLAALATTPDCWGSAWHVPSGPPLTQRELLTAAAAAAGLRAPRVRPYPPLALALAGLVSPPVRPLSQVAYQFRGPFVMDSTATQERLGLAPTPLGVALAETMAASTGARLAA